MREIRHLAYLIYATKISLSLPFCGSRGGQNAKLGYRINLCKKLHIVPHQDRGASNSLLVPKNKSATHARLQDDCEPFFSVLISLGLGEMCLFELMHCRYRGGKDWQAEGGHG